MKDLNTYEKEELLKMEEKELLELIEKAPEEILVKWSVWPELINYVAKILETKKEVACKSK